MENSELILEYLKIFLTWPVIGGVLLLIFIFNFKSSIVGIFNRIRSAKVGNVEFEAPLIQKELSDIKSDHTLLDSNVIVNDSNDNSIDEQTYKEKYETLLGLYNDIQLEFYFEMLLNILFGTQLRLLQSINNIGDDGIDLDRIYPFYNENLSKSKLTNWGVNDFLRILINYNIINKNESTNKYQITPNGTNFLSYVEKNHNHKFQSLQF